MSILFNSCSALQEVSNVCKMGTRHPSWRSLWPRKRDVTAYPAICDRKLDREEVRGDMAVTGMGEGIIEHLLQVLRMVLSLSPSTTDWSPHSSVDSWINTQGFLEFHSTPPQPMLSIIVRCTSHQGSFLRSMTLPSPLPTDPDSQRGVGRVLWILSFVDWLAGWLVLRHHRLWNRAWLTLCSISWIWEGVVPKFENVSLLDRNEAEPP